MNGKPSVHELAIVEPGSTIGGGTRVWAFVHILPGAVVGADCNVCDHVFIEGDVQVGDRVTIKSGVQLWDGVRLEDDVFVGPNAAFTNDRFPRSRQHPDKYLSTVVRQGASIGANATILPGLTIGVGAMVGAGSVVTADVPPYAIVQGNPARISGYVDTAKHHAVETTDTPLSPASYAGTELIKLPEIEDLRGVLVFAETEGLLPFDPFRFFIVHNVPSSDVRGQHAHRECHQLLIAAHGAVSVVVDNGIDRVEIRLDDPSLALHIPPMIWATQYKYSSDAALLVLASHHYDADDYIRSYDSYREALSAQ
ncbi:MAG: WxcM-like domain-containing protein [Fimbriimonadaceae bacterium]|nr:WxcM-like domain-containing protein [Fimbriimonadaceae bacterium]